MSHFLAVIGIYCLLVSVAYEIRSTEPAKAAERSKWYFRASIVAVISHFIWRWLA